MDNSSNLRLYGAFQTLEDFIRYNDYFFDREFSPNIEPVSQIFFAAHIQLSNRRIIQLFNATHPAVPKAVPEHALKFDLSNALEEIEDLLKDKIK